MAQKKIERLDTWPEWFTGKTINEPIFCREFLERHHLAYTENSFFTTEGRVTNEDAMRQTIYQQLEPFIVTGMSKKVDDIMKDLRIKAQVVYLEVIATLCAAGRGVIVAFDADATGAGAAQGKGVRGA